IGILAAVAIPAYQDYTAKAKFGAALSEVSAGKIGFDARLNDGDTVTAPAEVGLNGPTSNCAFTATGASLTCKIVAGPSTVSGQDIVLSRDATSGIWACAAAGVPEKLIGKGTCVGKK
ncbi:MAG: Fimbrial protein pilin, partial [Massilia sp.]|nr:Fimbrial protein pilin [Massilia sp.]